MSDVPQVLVFDVNETLSDTGPLADAFVAAGAQGPLAATWFAGVLRDGIAFTAAGASRPFADVAAAGLRWELGRAGVPDVEAGVDLVLAALTSLAVHPDVVPGVRRLRERGQRMITLSNGSADVAERLLASAGLREAFELLLSVADAGAWKPSAQAYGYAARRLDVPAHELMLVAVHPWDLDGAARAGLRTAWLNRRGDTYPEVFRRPDVVVRELTELADALG